MVLAKPAASDSLKKTRDKDSSLAAALKTAVFNQMLSKSAILCLNNMQSRALPILSTQNSAFGEHLVESHRFESCRQAGILISGLFERIGSTRLCENHRLRAAARLESLSRVSLRESEIAGFATTTVLELPPGWNPYLGSL